MSEVHLFGQHYLFSMLSVQEGITYFLYFDVALHVLYYLKIIMLSEKKGDSNLIIARQNNSCITENTD